MNTPSFVSRASLKFFSGTLLSRVSGMLRDMSMAFFFGTDPLLAAFLLSFRFVYLSRRLFGEGLLHQGFIPHFEEKKKSTPKQAAIFFRDLFFSMSLFLGVLLILGEGVLFLFDSEVGKLARCMLPGVFFICLFGLSSGILQSEKSFFIPAVAPVSFNFVWILGVFAFHRLETQQAVLLLSAVISLAFFAQWLVTVPKMWKFLRRYLSKKELLCPTLFSPILRKLLGPLFFSAIGVASVQINSAIDGVFARFADPEGPAYLWYAIRMLLLPLSLFGIALSSALLPSLSRATKEEFKNLMDFGVRRILSLMVPCTFAIFVLGASSVNLLFGRGDFGNGSTLQTLLCLWGYGPSLVPSALILIFSTSFYAKKDYKTPMKGFVYSAVFNILLNAAFVFYFRLGVVSIAISTSITAFFNAIYLYRKMEIKRFKAGYLLRVLLAGFVAAGTSLSFGKWLGDGTLNGFLFVRDFSSQLSQFTLQTVLFGGIFLLICKLFGINIFKFDRSNNNS